MEAVDEHMRNLSKAGGHKRNNAFLEDLPSELELGDHAEIGMNVDIDDRSELQPINLAIESTKVMK